MKIKHILLLSLAVISLLFILGFGYIYYLLNASLPQTEGTIKVSGIEKSVEITFDQMGIAQIWAETERDAWFTVGWLQAGDRLFQMDLTRRVATGRLSEMFGASTLEVDRLQRKLGHHRMASMEVSALDSVSLNYLRAYVEGINSWVKHTAALPFEYQLLTMDFESWTLEDCLAIISFQCWYSGALQNRDDFYYNLADLIGRERTEQLIIPYPQWAPTTVPPSMAQASNAWAIAPEKSSSGKAILASDPHLEVIRLPQFWYAVGIHSVENNLNSVGITTPGLPFIVYGHNDYAGWGFTAAGVDINDQYIEKIKPSDQTRYKTPDGWQKFDIFKEIIRIKDLDECDTLFVKLSRHGPIISENDSLFEAYSLHWAGFDQSLAMAINTGFDLVKVKTFSDFRNGVTRFSALDASWIYADKEGNIGYQLGTPIPIRSITHSHFKLPGWIEENDWSGYWPLEATPHAYNPHRGWLASCNNKPDQENLPYDLMGNFADDRILRITELLLDKARFSVEDMKLFQLDRISNYLLRWKDEVSRILIQMGEQELAQKITHWRGHTDPNAREVALIETWLFYLKQFIFSDDFNGKMNDIRNKVLLKDSQLEYIYFNSVQNWIDDGATEEHIETADEIAERAMRKALDEVKDRKWGDIQSLTIAHPMAQVPVLVNLLGLEKGPFPRGGTAGTLNAAFSFKNDQEGFDCIVAPSWRMIMDFANLDSMLIAMPAGQSGNPRSDHFFDFYQWWDQGKYWILPYTKEKVYARSVSILSLKSINQR